MSGFVHMDGWAFMKNRNGFYMGASENILIAAGVNGPRDIYYKDDSVTAWTEQAMVCARTDKLASKNGTVIVEEILHTQDGYKKLGICKKLVGDNVVGSIWLEEMSPTQFILDNYDSDRGFYVEGLCSYVTFDDLILIEYITSRQAAEEKARLLGLSTRALRHNANKLKKSLFQTSSDEEVAFQIQVLGLGSISSHFYQQKLLLS